MENTDINLTLNYLKISVFNGVRVFIELLNRMVVFIFADSNNLNTCIEIIRCVNLLNLKICFKIQNQWTSAHQS